jgi:hypothetical protein
LSDPQRRILPNTLSALDVRLDTLPTNAWIPMVFLGLLGAGVAVHVLSEQAKQWLP